MSRVAIDATKLAEIAEGLRSMSEMLLHQIAQIDALLASAKLSLDLQDPEARNARAKEITENLLARLRRTNRTNLEASGVSTFAENRSVAKNRP